MGYTAIGLLLLGFAVGSMSRFRILLLVVVPLLPASILFARLRGFGLLDTVLTIFIAQTIVQTSFVSGLVARTTVGLVLGARTATQ